MLAEMQDALDAYNGHERGAGPYRRCEIGHRSACQGPESDAWAWTGDCAACTIALHAAALRAPTAPFGAIDRPASWTFRDEINERIRGAGLPLPLVPVQQVEQGVA